MKRALSVTLLTFGLISLSQAAVQATFYVSPTGTGDYSQASPGALSGILAKVKTVNTGMTGDVVVVLGGGRYTLASTFALAAADGGTGGHNVIYQAAAGQSPVLSAGTTITSAWTVSDAAKGIYKTNIGTGAIVNARQLYVNGHRAIRARSVNGSGWTLNGSSFSCPSAAASWKNPTSVEIVCYSAWRCYRLNVSGISGTTASVKAMFGQSWAPMTDPQWIENAYELLDAPGEWYLDRTNGDLFYKPLAGESMTSPDVVVPNLASIMTLTSVSNVQFNGITFSHNTWTDPNTNGINADQADGLLPFNSKQVAVSITLDHCKSIRFANCTFEHIGCTALGIMPGASNCTVFNSVFRDISASGIRVGAPSPLVPATADVVKDDSISNNLIRDIAAEYKNSVAIMMYFPDHAVVTHNEIRNCPYSAISLGWTWNDPPQATGAKNNEIAYNRIDSIMTDLDDGCGVYQLGSDPGATVHGNYISNQFHLFGNIYMDNGCTGPHWYNNVLTNGVFWAMFKGTNTVDNNWICSMQNGSSPIDQSSGGITESNNTYVGDGPNCTWPAAAQAIINAAGRVNIPTQSVMQAIGSDDGARRMTIGNGVAISVPRGAENVTYSIVNASGRLVRQNTVTVGAGPRLNAASTLPAGVYYVKVQCVAAGKDLAVESRRFVVK